jgi:hypothetical protein
VNLDPGFVRSFPSMGYGYAWSGLDDIFNRDDLTVINLECSASDLGTPWDKPWTFRCDPEALPSMAAAGVDVANLANNHAMDYGFEAMIDARANLAGVGIDPVGAGANAAEAYAPVLVERNGWTIAILGGGGVHPETGSWIATDDRPGMTDGDSAEAMTRAIRAADEIADLVLVTIHWGKRDPSRRSVHRRRSGRHLRTPPTRPPTPRLVQREAHRLGTRELRLAGRLNPSPHNRHRPIRIRTRRPHRRLPHPGRDRSNRTPGTPTRLQRTLHPTQTGVAPGRQPVAGSR